MFTASLPLLLVTFAPYVTAHRGGGRGGSHTSLHKLDLNSVNTATFSIFIILALFTLFQHFSCVGMLRRERSHRLPFSTLLVTILLLVARYMLGAVDVSMNRADDLGSSSTLGPLFTAMLQLTSGLADVFMGATLLLLIDQRHLDFARTHGLHLTSTKKRALDGMLLFLMLASTVISQAVFASIFSTPDPGLSSRVAVDFYHIYIASYILVTLDIIFSSFVLWNRLMKASSVDNYFRVVLKFVCPLLLIRALFDLALDIVTSLPQGTTSIDYDALLLSTVLVEGLSYFCVLYCLLASRKS